MFCPKWQNRKGGFRAVFFYFPHLLCKKLVVFWLLTKLLVSLHCSIKQVPTMKTKREITMKVTDEEEELIMAIRNYCDSYPDGYPELLEYAQDIFDRMTDMPKG